MNAKHASAASDIPETEEELVRIAETAVSACRWTVGECASKWTKRYAKGRTDHDFGALIGLSGDQIYQRRRVWETFSDVRQQFADLRWSHFYAALNWDDAPECLQWAEETHSTVAEMKAWRRATRGEDLTSQPDEAEEGSIAYLSGEPAFVQDPATYGHSGGSSRGGAGSRGSSTPESEETQGTLAGVARGLHSDEEYAPFRQGAMKPAPTSGKTAGNVAEPRVSPEQVAKRICSTLERCTKALGPDYAKAFRKLPQDLQKRMINAVAALQSAVSDLM